MDPQLCRPPPEPPHIYLIGVWRACYRLLSRHFLLTSRIASVMQFLVVSATARQHSADWREQRRCRGLQASGPGRILSVPVSTPAGAWPAERIQTPSLRVRSSCAAAWIAFDRQVLRPGARWINWAVICSLLFKASSETTLTIAADPFPQGRPVTLPHEHASRSSCTLRVPSNTLMACVSTAAPILP